MSKREEKSKDDRKKADQRLGEAKNVLRSLEAILDTSEDSEETRQKLMRILKA
jgi:hypothetical protein